MNYIDLCVGLPVYRKSFDIPRIYKITFEYNEWLNHRKRTQYVRSEVLAAVRMTMLLFWAVTSCRFVGTYQPIGRWRQYVSPKRLYLPTNLHGVTTQSNNVVNHIVSSQTVDMIVCHIKVVYTFYLIEAFYNYLYISISLVFHAAAFEQTCRQNSVRDYCFSHEPAFVADRELSD
jgi:hypothetical protein